MQYVCNNLQFRQVCKKLLKNKSIDVIAEELEEDSSVIESIYLIANQFTPNYDIEKIFDELKANQSF